MLIIKRTQMELIETINPVHLENLLEFWDNEDDLQHLVKYYKKQSSGGKVKVKYILPKSQTSRDYCEDYVGRVYPQGSLGVVCFRKIIQQYLLTSSGGESLIWDFDIQNCIPTLYLHYLKQLGVDVKTLFPLFESYVLNPNKWRGDNLEIRSIVKTNIIITINGGFPTYFPYENLKKLCDEIRMTREKIRENFSYENQPTEREIEEIITRETSVLEREIIDYTIKWFKDAFGIQTSSYSWDGISIPKDSIPKEEIKDALQKLNTSLWNKFHIVGLNIDTKEFDYNSQNWKDLIEFIETKKNQKDKKITLIEGKYLSDYFQDNIIETPMEGNIFVVKGMMGIGKTNKITNDIRNYRIKFPDKNLTTITLYNRISLIDSIYNDEDYDGVYTHYQKNSSYYIDGINKSMLVCIESLKRFTPETLKNIDVLVLDELESVIPQLQSYTTHGDYISLNQNIFLSLIKNPKIKLIITDANISNDTIKFIMKMRKIPLHSFRKITKLEFQPIKEKNILYYTTNGDGEYSKWENNLLKDIQQGLNIIIPITSKVIFGNALTLTIIEKTGISVEDIIYINKDTKNTPECQEIINDTKKWDKYRVILYSPTISSGVSYKGNHFHKVYSYFTRMTTNPLDSSQMIGRVRNPKTNEIHIYVELNKCNQKFTGKPLTEKQLLKNILNNTNEFFQNEKLKIGDWKFNHEEFRETLEINDRTLLWLFTKSQQLKYYNNYLFWLKKSLENSYKIPSVSVHPPPSVSVSGEETERSEEGETGKTTKENQKILEEITYRQTFSITPQETLTEEQYKTLTERSEEGKSELNPLDVIKIQNFKFGKKYKLSPEQLWNYTNNFIKSLPTDEKFEYTTFKNHINYNYSKVVENISRIFRLKPYDRNETIILPEGVNPFHFTEEEEQSLLSTHYIPKRIEYTDDSLYQSKEAKSSAAGVEKITHSRSLENVYEGKSLEILLSEKTLKIMFPQRDLFQTTRLDTNSSQIQECWMRWKNWILTTSRITDYYKYYKVRLNQKELHSKKSIQEIPDDQKEWIEKIINPAIKILGMKFWKNTSRKTKDGKKQTIIDGWELRLLYPIVLHEKLIPVIKLSTEQKRKTKTKEFELSIDLLPIILPKKYINFEYDIDYLKTTIFYDMKY